MCHHGKYKNIDLGARVLWDLKSGPGQMVEFDHLPN